MKYLQKFDESVSQPNYITQSDFDKIEDLFLFWSDERPIKYGLGGIVLDGVKNEESLKIGFDYTTSNHPKQRSKTSGESICYDKENLPDFLIGDTTPKRLFNSFIYKIKNLSDVEENDGPFPKTEPQQRGQKILSFLDLEYNIKQDICDILYRTKGLDYYGFKWSLNLYLAEKRLYTGPFWKPQLKVCFDFEIVLSITK